MRPTPSILALAIALAITMTACGGGGGGGTRSNPPPPVVAPPTQPTSELLTRFRTLTGADKANGRGLTGVGVKVGIVDSGVNPEHPSLKGKITWIPYGNLTIEQDPPTNINGNDYTHGTQVAMILGGNPTGAYQGGIAPGVTIAMGRNSSWPTPQRMIDWGAKIINYSFGDTFNLDDATSNAALYTQYYGEPIGLRYIKDGGALLVVSAGNSGKSGTSLMSGGRYFHPELTNMLVAVAYDPESNDIAAYSNRCGERARNYCLAGVSTVLLPKAKITTTPLSEADYQHFMGTSAAAPNVAGVGALVAQAYPWMNGTQIANTLLSTATDIGAPGVDAVFGWGLVNADRATRGPGTASAMVATPVPAGMVSVFSNDIDGEGGFQMTGAGTLVLAGHNTYTGGTQISAGTVRIDGSVAGSVDLQHGALAGRGRIEGDIRGQGLLDLDTGGALRVDGTVDLDQIRVRVDTDARGTSSYMSQWSGTVLSAGALTGGLRLDQASPWFQTQALTQDHQVVARLARLDTTQVMAMGDTSQRASAGRVEQAFQALDQGAGSVAIRNHAASLQHTSMEAAAAAMDTLNGQGLATARDTTVETGAALDSLLDERVRDAGWLPGDAGGAWVAYGHPDSRADADGWFSMTTRSQLMLGGVDRAVNETWTVGLGAFSAKDDSTLTRDGGRMEGTRKGGLVYARWAMDDRWINTRVSVAAGEQDSERTLWTGGADIGVARGQTTSRSVGFGVEAGQWLGERFAVAARLEGEQARIVSKDETGSTGFELAGSRDRIRRLDAGLALQYRRELSPTWSVDGMLGYRRSLVAPDTGFETAFLGAPMARFTVDGMPWSRDAATWGAGLTYQPGWSLWWIRADGQQSSYRDRATVSAGVRVAW